MTKIKLCGLKRLEDIEVVNHLKPDFIGFIFVENSKRYINPIQAFQLKKSLNKDIKAVGVFVDEDIDIIKDIVEMNIIDMVQVHGSEDEIYLDNLRQAIKVPVIQAYKINTLDDVLKAVDSKADYILLDSKTGGSGSSFDWSLIKELKRDYFLAGGLSSDNVRDAIQTLNPYAVDVSSGIEIDGLKDKEKMCAFVEKVRSANV